MLLVDRLMYNYDIFSESWTLANNISSFACITDKDLRKVMWYYAYGNSIIDCAFATNVICYVPSQNDTDSYRLSMSNWYTSPRYTNYANFLLGGADASKYTSYSYYCYYVHNDMEVRPSNTAGKLPIIHCGNFHYNNGAGPMGLGILLWCRIEYYDSSDYCQHTHYRLIFYHDGTGSISDWYGNISFNATCYIDCFDYSLFECNGGNITRITAYVKVLAAYDLCSTDLTSVTSYIPNFKTYYELNKNYISVSYDSYNPRTGEYIYADVTFNDDNGGYTSNYAISEYYSGRNGGGLHWDSLSMGNYGELSIYAPFAIRHASSSLSYI